MDDEMNDQAAEVVIQLLLFYRDQFKKGTCMKHPGIQEAHFRLLNLLYCESPLSMSTLGRILYISKPHMTTLIDGLIKDGLVERLPDPHDRRVINVTITEKGRESLQGTLTAMKEEFRSQLSNLEPSDIGIICSSGNELLKVLSKLQ